MHWTLTKQNLECHPSVPEHVARPWDSADEYLLDVVDTTLPTLIFNDRYGALALNLPTAELWLESACAREATDRNLHANGLSTDRTWATAVSRDIEQIILRAPKDFDQLQYWLWQCQQVCSSNVSIYIAGMSKHIPIKWLNWLEQNCQTYHQLPQRRKARLIQVQSPGMADTFQAMTGYSFEQLSFEALPGVFGRHQPDVGGQLLLDVLTRKPEVITGRVCDLGCGNGLLGLTLKQRYSELEFVLTDDSRAASESARHNAKTNQLGVEFCHGDTLAATTGKFDTIVCNPPFHDGHRLMTNLAERMFEQAAQRLNTSGQLLVVANRHLPYQAVLKQQFGTVKQYGKDPKFIVYLCSNPSPLQEKRA